jgi:hypothetical protein
MENYNHIIFNVAIYLGAISFIVCMIIYVNKTYKNKPKKSHWNYRVGTKITKTPIGEYREYLIFTGYYKNEVLDSYGISETYHYDDVEDMQKSFKKIQKAFKKPIIDLDNFPSVFVPEKD